jgi:YVTN family beta-propeller protein
MNLHTIRSFDTKMKPEQLMAMARSAVHFACFLVLLFAVVAVKAQEPPPIPKLEPANSLPKVPTHATRAQKVVQQGIAIEFTVDPSAKNGTKVIAGEDANIEFKVTDTTTGTPVKGLNLSAWLSLREGAKAPDAAQCHAKIQSYLTGSMRARPEVDLNSYYILVLNKSADISVIDPLLSFGGSKLLTLVMMKSPGEDWVLTKDGEKLFVTLPQINQVAVIDTRSWKVASYIDTGVKPTRITLQPDQKYAWIVHEGGQPAASGVTVIDTGTLKVVAQISTGAGRHDIVVSRDNRFAFVSNRESGTVSIVDVRKLEKVTDVKVGPGPVSLALSELSKAIYAASETDGSIAVIDEQGQLLTRIKVKPGSRLLRFAPGGRYGFVLNTNESIVSIFDAASNRMLHEVKVGKAPDQVIFSDTFAFIRSLETESVAMIRLSTIGTEIDITEFPGGQAIPAQGSSPVRADSIVLAPEGNAVILANPVDKVLYYYTEGMAAPMGNFQNYRREPLAVLIVDRSLRETNPGVYSTTVKLPASGNYDVAFLTDSPRISHCFEAAADPNLSLKGERSVAFRIEPQVKEMNLTVGQNFPLRFKLIETSTNKVKNDLKDVRVLTFLAPGTWQRRDIATSVGDGIYEINLNVPETGVYMVFVESGSMGVRYRDLPPLTLEAIDQKSVPEAVTHKP